MIRSSILTCADGKAYSVTGLSDSWAALESSPASNCLAVGDEVLLINLQGTLSNYANTGNYEFLRIGGIVGNQVYFTAAKTKYYGSGASDDANIGLSAGQQRVMLLRVPNYNNVTINGTLTASAWNGYKYGMAVFRANGTLSGGGTISTSGLGYLGAAYSAGEGVGGYGGLGVGGTGDCGPRYPGASGYGTNGESSWYKAGGLAYGEPSLAKPYFGAGGSMFGIDVHGVSCGSGGPGGGYVYGMWIYDNGDPEPWFWQHWDDFLEDLVN